MTDGFRLHVLTLVWTDLRHRYRMDEVWPELACADLRNPAFVFTETDLRAYDWDHQEIWLNQPAIDRFVHARPDQRSWSIPAHAFVVTLGEERLYGGVFYDEHGAAAIRFPVIHALGTPVEFLRIRPALGGGWFPEQLAAQRQAIANPRLAEQLARAGLIQSIPEVARPRDPHVLPPTDHQPPTS